MTYRAMCKRILAGAALAGVALAAPGAAEELMIVENGSSAYVIALADESEPQRIQEAARLLRATVAEATGVELPVMAESEVPDGTSAIYLGKSAAARRAGLPVDEIAGWSYWLRAVGPDIFLIGEDRAGPEDTGSGGYYGSLKAVTAFLERAAGVRFVLPGPMGTHVPTLDRLTVEAGLDRRWDQVFDYVVGRSVSGQDRAYALANNFFGKDQHVVRGFSGHSHYHAVPERQYGESNPEYFALLGGVRTPRGNHLCISNPDVQELMLQLMERELDKGFAWVQLGQTDGYQACECAECAALHPEPGERLWIVHRMLAEEMERRRPGKKVMIISYAPTAPPPASFDAFPDNVVIEMTRYTEEAFAEWAAFDMPKTVYIFSFLGTTPRTAPRYAVDQIRRFASNDVRGIHLGGGLDQGNSPWGLLGPSYYAFGKAMEDHPRDAAELEHEYITAAFGEAAVPMRAFFQAMHRRWEVYALIDGQRAYSFGPKAGDMLCHFFPPKVLNDMSANLERAMRMAVDEKVKARLALVEAEFRYLRAVASVYHVYRTYRLTPSWEALDLLEAQVRAYQDVHDWLYPYEEGVRGRTREIAGMRRPFNGRMGVAAGGAPFNWDFDLLRREQVLPGTGVRELTVTRTEPFELDGRFDKAAWRDRTAHALSEVMMGPAVHPAQFKVAYDDRHFYLAFEGEIASPTALDTVVSLGRGGAAYRQENIEILLDPFGERDRYVHLILNPAEHSTFERRFGYIDDPLHPQFGDFEPGWRGEWEYAFHIDRENRKWTAEVRIPFSTLDAPPPEPGTVWTMNVGRTELRDEWRSERIFSLWSPNLESRSFHERSAFGVAEFE